MITREKVKRLAREAETLNPDNARLPFVICTERAELFYYNDKPYKTTDELIKDEQIKPEQTLIIIKKYN